MIPVLCWTEKRTELTLLGGTNNPFAPPIDNLQTVVVPILSLLGVKGSIRLIKRGFYPKGKGIVKCSFQPINQILPLTLHQYDCVSEIRGIAYSARLPCHIVQRMAEKAKTRLQIERLMCQITTECLQASDSRCASSPGTRICLYAELVPFGRLGSDMLGERGLTAERVGSMTASNLLLQLRSRAPIDKFLGDQLIPLLALASGSSIIRVSELTSHTNTCIEITKQLTNAQFNINKGPELTAKITCQSIGLTR
jgi:RNA 3'-phosphate cyclase